MKKKDVFLITLRCLAALTLFLVAVLNYDQLSTLDVKALVSFTRNVPLICAIVLAVYLVKSLVFVVPASMVYVAVGAILPTAVAVAVNLTGIWIEVSATWLLGFFLGRDAVERLLKKKPIGQKLLEKDPGDRIGVLLAIRAVPAFPIDFVSLLYGASGAKYPKYALFSVLGISWRVILFTVIGDAVFSWIPTDKIILAVICCIPVGVAYYLVKKLVIEPKKLARSSAGVEDASEE